MNHQWWRTARRPGDREVPTLLPLSGAMLDTDLHVSTHPAARLIRNRSGCRASMSGVPVEFVELPARGRVFRGRRRVHLGDVDAGGRLRLEALARYLQDVATDDADDARLSERRGVWVLRSSDLEITGVARVPRDASSWRRSAAGPGRVGPSGARS